MDIARPSNARQKQLRRAGYAAIGLVIVAGVSVGLSRLRPAAPTVDAATLWPDTVKRGPMVRQVRGSERWFLRIFAGSRPLLRDESSGFCSGPAPR